MCFQLINENAELSIRGEDQSIVSENSLCMLIYMEKYWFTQSMLCKFIKFIALFFILFAFRKA